MGREDRGESSSRFPDAGETIARIGSHFAGQVSNAQANRVSVGELMSARESIEPPPETK